MTTSPGDTAAHLARLVVGRSARRLAPRISTTSKDADIQDLGIHVDTQNPGYSASMRRVAHSCLTLASRISDFAAESRQS
jgi:hypothetical protein